MATRNARKTKLPFTDRPVTSNAPLVLGCDVGGALKFLSGEDPLPGALETVARFEQMGIRIVLISKCGPAYAATTVAWLARHGLAHLPIEFTDSYEGKVAIAKRYGVHTMIDDKMCVLKHFFTAAPGIRRIWVCGEPKNIRGAWTHDPAFMASSVLVQSWTEIAALDWDFSSSLHK